MVVTNARVALAAVVLVLATALSACAVVVEGHPVAGRGTTEAPEGPRPVRVASAKVKTGGDSTEPLVVLALYEDLLCPACRRFEDAFGPTIEQLIDDGDVAVDYYFVAILDSPANEHYSSRSGAAAYCVGEATGDTQDKQAFQRFHAALLAQQPLEYGTTFPSDADLAETARQAGADGDAADCIADGRNVEMVEDLARDEDVSATPTVRINGEDYEWSTPAALEAEVQRALR